jgi:hypothetical protein
MTSGHVLHSKVLEGFSLDLEDFFADIEWGIGLHPLLYPNPLLQAGNQAHVLLPGD